MNAPAATASAADAPAADTRAAHARAAARRLPPAVLLLLAYLALWAVLAVAPADRATWWLENLLPLSLVALLAGTWRHWPLSDAAYASTAAFLALHAVGAHWGYPEVPAGDWVRGLFHAAGWATTRNPYDRVVHFAFGLCLLRPLEDAMRRIVWRPRAATVLAVAAILALGGLYEVLEWAAARLLAPDAATTFVGAQGDPWDAQQDLALAGVGCAVALLVRAGRRPRPRAAPADRRALAAVPARAGHRAPLGRR